jgi:hypothetical protein
MAWSWGDTINTGIGIWDAWDKSKNALDPKDLFYLSNPSHSNPFYDRTTNWNSGKPTIDSVFSSSMQPIADAFFANIGKAPDTRETSQNLQQLANANQNWQKARYGMQPSAFNPTPAPPVGGGGVAPPGGRIPPGSGIIGGGGNGTDGGRIPPGGSGGAGQGSNNDALDRIFEGLIGSGLIGGSGGSVPGGGTGGKNDSGSSLGGSGGSGWRGEEGKTGWEWLDNSGYNPFTWRDDWNASDLEKLFGMKDIGSLGGLNAPGAVGSIIGAIAGVPGGGKIGEWAGDYFDQIGYNPGKGYFSPTDTDNPYATDGSGGNMVDDLMNPDKNLPRSPAEGGGGGRGGGSWSPSGGSSGGGWGSGGGSAGRFWGSGLRSSRIT